MQTQTQEEISKNEATARQEALQVWSVLLNRQLNTSEIHGCNEFQNGLKTIGFSASNLPQPEEINKILSHETGWTVLPVSGIVEDELFFSYLAQKKFPVTWWIRSARQIDYLEEPDLFHDLFGHVPLLTNNSFCHFLKGLGQLGQQFAGDPEAIHLLSRFYWYTVEFGLIRQDGRRCIYGAGILSSASETHRALSRTPMLFEYNEEQILHTPYRKDQFQDRYFIIDSFQKLFESLPEVASGIQERLNKRRIFHQVSIDENEV